MKITHIKKRNGELQEYDTKKIAEAVKKALIATGETEADRISEAVTSRVHENLHEYCTYAAAGEGTQCADGQPTVEEIQDLVERSLMELGHYESAKAYILYRNKKDKERVRDLFKKRTALKPYEYPELIEYVHAIRHSYWIHTEFNYTSDIHDYKVNITESEREAIKRTMLAIAQIEVAVKTFWGNLYTKMPKPEIGAVGTTFAESEVRHTDAYSHLLEILGLNDEFASIRDIPVLNDRYNYLERVSAMSQTDDNSEYAQAVLLFSLFIEHVSLFSQFLIMMSFNKHKNLFKGVSNAVEATSKEEQIHGFFGIELINLIKEEHPEWFKQEWNDKITQFCTDTYEVERQLIDWIFENGELSFLPITQIEAFIQQRLNNSLEAVGVDPLFVVSQAELEKTEWFDNEVIATKHVDFFQKRSINYNKRKQSITGDDLF
jgi:ribonucleoside-diphosphate reductase beta chain